MTYYDMLCSDKVSILRGTQMPYISVELTQIFVSNVIGFDVFLARLYESTGRAIAVTTASASASALLKRLKFFG